MGDADTHVPLGQLQVAHSRGRIVRAEDRHVCWKHRWHVTSPRL